MNLNKRTLWNIALAAVITVGGLFASDDLSPTAPLVSKAEARVGRPATPASVAGVARRTTRRTVAAGAAAGAAAYGAQRYYYGSACGYYPYPPCWSRLG
jgi:hypothetical protein